MRVRDGRRTPFSLVTHITLEAIHAEFVGPERSSAMSLYLALAARVSKERGRGNVDEVIEGTKGEIGEEAGLSAKTVERITQRFVSIGILALQHRSGRPSLWLLVEPGDVVVDDDGNELVGAPASPCRDLAEPDPRHGDATPASPCRDPRVTMSRVPVKARAGSGGRREEEEVEGDAGASDVEIQSPERQVCELVAQHVLELDPAAAVDPSAPDWQREARALLEQRDIDQVLDVIAWIRRDSFWSGRVLNPAHLAKHFPQIVAIRAGANAIGHQDTAARGRRRAARDRRDRRIEEQRANAGECCAAPDSPPLPAEAEWTALAPELKGIIGEDLFDLWFAGAHAHSGGDDELLLAAPYIAASSIRDRFAGTLEQLAGRRLEVVVCESASP